MERGWERTRGRGELMRAGRVSSSSSRFPRSWASPLAGERAPSMDWAALGLGSSPESPGSGCSAQPGPREGPSRVSRSTNAMGGMEQLSGPPDGAAPNPGFGALHCCWKGPQTPVFGNYPYRTAAGRGKGSGQCSSHPHHRAQGKQHLLPGMPSGREMAPANAQKPALIWPSFNPCRKEKNQAAAPAGAGSVGVWAGPG